MIEGPYKKWEDNPEFTKAIDKINNFAQSDVITEDEVDYIQSYYEDGEYEEVKRRLYDMMTEVEPLYKSIQFAYNYLENQQNNNI